MQTFYKTIAIVATFLLSFTIAMAATTVPWTKNGTVEYPSYINDSIGIGTSSPFTKLGVTGNSWFTGDFNVGSTAPNGIQSGIAFNQPWNMYSNINGYSALTIGNNSFGNGASVDLVFTDGSTTSSSNYTDMGQNGGNYDGSTYPAYAGFNLPHQTYLYNTDSAITFAAASTTATNAFINFLTGGGLVSNERLRITAAGLVGIGTTSPTFNEEVHGNLWVDSVGGTKGYSAIGAPIIAATGVTPNPASDTFVVGSTTTGTNQMRVLAATGIYNGAATANATMALNAFSSMGAAASGNMTLTTGGGGLRSRYASTNSSVGYNVAQMSGVSALLQVAGTLASSTDAADFHAETPVVNAGNLLTNMYGLWVRGGAVSGTLTNRYGVYIDNLVGGTNRFGVYQAGTSDNNYFAGNTGIGTSTPTSKLDVQGFVNVDKSSGYKQDAQTILYASSTIYAVFGGTGAGAGLIAHATSTDPTSGPKSTAFGYMALNSSTNTGNANTAFGANTLLFNGTGHDNTAVGNSTLSANGAGSYNVGLGGALFSNSNGNSNLGIGTSALGSVVSGSDNVGVGTNALTSTLGGTSVAIGSAAEFANTNANNVVAIGYSAGNGNYTSYNSQGSTYIGAYSGYPVITGSDYNTAVGYKSGFSLSSGNHNIILGAFDTNDSLITTGSNNIVIGNNISVTAGNSNQLDIGNFIYGTGLSGTGTTISSGLIGIGSTSPYADLSIQANNGRTNTTLFAIGSSTASATTTLFTVLNTGAVGIGSSSPWRTLDINGTVSIKGLTTSAGLQSGVLCISSSNEIINDSVACLASAKRFKQNISPLSATSSLQELMAINPVSYLYKPEFNGKLQSNPNYSGEFKGFIADDVGKIDPTLISVETSTTTGAINSYPGQAAGLKIDNIVAVLWSATQQIATHQSEQDKEIATLKEEVAQLQQPLAMCQI